MDDLISIIVPIYNVECYLIKCIDSIIKQTYERIEIILVDDGSIDKCGEICDDYSIKDKRIKVIHKKNGGLSDARNSGIDIAEGKYLTFVDSDDYISVDYIEYLYSLIIKNDCDISVCGNYFSYNYCRDKLKNDNNSDVEIYFSARDAIEDMLYSLNFNHSAWGKLYRASLFKDIKFPKGMNYEDYAIVYKVFSNSNKVAFGNAKKYYYVIRSGSIMKSKFDSKNMELIDISNDVTEFIIKKYPNLKKAAISRKIYSNIELLYSILMSDDRNIYKEFEEKVFKNIEKDKNIVLYDRKSRKNLKLKICILLFNRSIFKYMYSIAKKIKICN